MTVSKKAAVRIAQVVFEAASLAALVSRPCTAQLLVHVGLVLPAVLSQLYDMLSFSPLTKFQVACCSPPCSVLFFCAADMPAVALWQLVDIWTVACYAGMDAIVAGCHWVQVQPSRVSSSAVETIHWTAVPTAEVDHVWL
jgi:hypothetical protein